MAGVGGDVVSRGVGMHMARGGEESIWGSRLGMVVLVVLWVWVHSSGGVVVEEVWCKFWFV